ncbi:MAG: ATP synthase F1 subunit delta [Candidatus Aminicenantales bacterium]
MKSQILVKRYTRGLVTALRNQKEYQTVSRELEDFQSLLSSHEGLWNLLCRPFLTTSKKIQIVREILAKKSYQDKTSRFIILLLEHKRLELLKEILSGLPVAWREQQGILTLEVRSVVPLKEGQKKKLQKELQMLEKSPVHLEYMIDPELLGGLAVRKGNQVYDASLKGHLMKLKERMSER